MTGITQMVLTQAEPIVGFRGRLADSRSLVFGETANSPLTTADTFAMSSLTMQNLTPIGSGSWTIEYWVNFRITEFSNSLIHQNGQAIIGSGSVTGGIALFHLSSAIRLNNYLVTNANFTINSTGVPTQSWQPDIWYHVVIVKNSSNQVSSFVNGYRSPVGILNNTVNYNISPNTLGTWRNTYGVGTTNNLIGSLYNPRIVVGSAVYDITQSSLLVPKIPLSLYSTTTKLLLKSPRSDPFQDLSGTTTLTLRTGNPVNQTQTTPFHDAPASNTARTSYSSPFDTKISGSYYFQGKNSYKVTYTKSGQMAFGSGDFSIEWFSYNTGLNSSSTIFWHGTTSSPSIGLKFEGGGSTVDVVLYTQGGGSVTLISGLNRSVYFKLWTHFAITRISNLVYFYINGILQNPGGTSVSTVFSDSVSTLFIAAKGSTGTDNDAFAGYITNFRVIRSLAVYSSSSFTVPTSNVTRISEANPFGGANTAEVKSHQVSVLMVP